MPAKSAVIGYTAQEQASPSNGKRSLETIDDPNGAGGGSGCRCQSVTQSATPLALQTLLAYAASHACNTPRSRQPGN